MHPEADWASLSGRHLVTNKDGKVRADSSLESEMIFELKHDEEWLQKIWLVYVLSSLKIGPVVRAKVRFPCSDFRSDIPMVGWITACVLPYDNGRTRLRTTYRFCRIAKEDDFRLLRDGVPFHPKQAANMSRPDFVIPKHRSWNHEMADQPSGLDEFNHYDNGQKTEFI
eukprot:5120238-Amphidinium_carterae.1